MRRKDRSRRKPPKSRQVHFWVDPALLAAFESMAGRVGEKLTDAHRAAMKGYIDENADAGSVFLIDTSIALGGERLVARIFSRGERELLVHLCGKPVRNSIRLLRGAREAGGLVEHLSRVFLEKVAAPGDARREKRK
jgi:hypothetical protein